MPSRKRNFVKNSYMIGTERSIKLSSITVIGFDFEPALKAQMASVGALVYTVAEALALSFIGERQCIRASSLMADDEKALLKSRILNHSIVTWSSNPKDVFDFVVERLKKEPEPRKPPSRKKKRPSIVFDLD